MANGAGFYRNRYGHVIIQVYDPERKATRKVPRDECAHLDGAGDEVVGRWRDLYLQRTRAVTERVAGGELAPTEEAAFLFRQFLDEHQRLRKTSSSTRADEEGRWRGFVQKFFVGECAARDVRLWSMYAADFPNWLATTALKTNQQKKVLNLTRRFGEFLKRHRKVAESWTFMIPVDNAAAATPLCYELKPEEVIAFALEGRVRTRLMALLGYFAGLRPEETIALKKSDFFTGDRARSLSKTFKRFEAHGLGSGLSVAVSRAYKKDGRIDEPKTRASRAVVNVWHQEGARVLGLLLRDLPDGWLFPGVRKDAPICRDAQFKFWAKYGLRGGSEADGGVEVITLHDLRRASCLFLGRTLDLPVTIVQEHMRHSDLKTTMLYMRRPDVVFAAPEDQNWNDVG